MVLLFVHYGSYNLSPGLSQAWVSSCLCTPLQCTAGVCSSALQCYLSAISDRSVRGIMGISHLVTYVYIYIFSLTIWNTFETWQNLSLFLKRGSQQPERIKETWKRLVYSKLQMLRNENVILPTSAAEPGNVSHSFDFLREGQMVWHQNPVVKTSICLGTRSHALQPRCTYLVELQGCSSLHINGTQQSCETGTGWSPNMKFPSASHQPKSAMIGYSISMHMLHVFWRFRFLAQRHAPAHQVQISPIQELQAQQSLDWSSRVFPGISGSST